MAVAIEVSRRGSHAGLLTTIFVHGDADIAGDIGEGAVAIVAIQNGRR